MDERVRGSRRRIRESRRQRRIDERVEARERRRLVAEVELLHVREEAVGAERPEHEEAPLEGATAGPRRPRVRPAHEKRVGAKLDHLVDAGGDLVRGVEERAEPAAEGLDAARGPDADGSVIHELDAGGEDGADRLDRDRLDERRTARAVAAARACAVPSARTSACRSYNRATASPSRS